MNLMIKRGARYVLIGLFTFGLDLALLFIFIDALNIDVLTSTAVAFLIAISLNYVLSRQFVFQNSRRPVMEAYWYFILFATLALIATVGLMWYLTTYTALHFATSRIIIAAMVGIANYFANLLVNFRVAGVEIE